MFLEEYLPQLIKTAAHIVIFIILRLILIMLVRRFAKNSERIEHRTGLILKYIDFAIIFLMIMGMILIWGVEFSDLGWVMSSVFAVIGIAFFAQWSILSNITSGIIMFFTFPYKIGDYIKVHDKEFPMEGIIEDIKTFHLVLRTNQGEFVTYPNSLMLQKGVSVIKPDHIDDFLHEDDKNVKEQPID
ncbi:mechanosensitive ion channel-like protein [Ulvibacter sp. MAR_2010_11]|uniref:mechanosensitive ion channel domain-containing protein n=1 Tax=Ulvibacter sp. MAR_2010_11 TaxID=1250229 RepID=UPI000C2C8386|nr:mechanosensitive ion channel domain-containing protein [Ulvibacter sp. MAR_2010_11]PKA83998.1 mechanosensitive ion channel-like protein [Ulvibacter sp. MAR_2010_11]